MTEKVLKLKPSLEAMKVGEEMVFPLKRLYSVKTTASNVGLVLGRRYKTHYDKANGTATVTRVS